MRDNESKQFKLNGAGREAGLGYKTGSPGKFREEISKDLQENLEKFKDPVVIGEMLYKLLEERENTNRILKNILARLDELAAQGKGAQAREIVKEMPGEILLPEVDEKILRFVKSKGKVTAEDVRKKFRYRGKNAASARLNKLCNMGLLYKQQVGKKVYFLPK